MVVDIVSEAAQKLLRLVQGDLTGLSVAAAATFMMRLLDWELATSNEWLASNHLTVRRENHCLVDAEFVKHRCSRFGNGWRLTH